MGSKFSIVEYSPDFESAWDSFVLQESVNGTFLQTRNFYNYHPQGRFQDCSLIIRKGNEIMAVIPANCIMDNGKKTFASHMGSTFGGIVLRERALNIQTLEEIFNLVEEYLVVNRYHAAIFKQSGKIYCRSDMDLLDYFFFYKGYESNLEIGFYIDFSRYDEDIISNYSSSRRRDYRYSLKYNFTFCELFHRVQIEKFYEVLQDNYTKFGKKPIHSLDELFDLFENRLQNEARFFGVFSGSELVAGAMIFCFERNVFHTQYLAVLQDKARLFVNEYMYTSLIQVAKEEKFKLLSFGTATLNNGRILNHNLAQYKEGYGTKQYNNLTFTKNLEIIR